MPKVPHYFLRHAHTRYRSSRLEVFCKKGVVRNFAKVTGKHLCQSLLFDIDEGLRPATLLKRRLWHRCFSENFVEFLRTLFFIEHLWWLLIEIYDMFVYKHTETMKYVKN